MRAKKLEEDRQRLLNNDKYLERKKYLEEMTIDGEKEIATRKQREIEEIAAEERRQAEALRVSQDRNLRARSRAEGLKGTGLGNVASGITNSLNLSNFRK